MAVKPGLWLSWHLQHGHLSCPEEKSVCLSVLKRPMRAFQDVTRRADSISWSVKLIQLTCLIWAMSWIGGKLLFNPRINTQNIIFIVWYRSLKAYISIFQPAFNSRLIHTDNLSKPFGLCLRLVISTWPPYHLYSITIALKPGTYPHLSPAIPLHSAYPDMLSTDQSSINLM